MAEQDIAEHRDAERYRKLRAAVFAADNIDIGEATLGLRVVGQCPSPDEFDAAIDELSDQLSGEQ